MEAWGYNEKAAPGGQRIDTATTTVHTQTSGSGNEKYYWTHADFGATRRVGRLPHLRVRVHADVRGDHRRRQEARPATPATHPNLWNQ